MESKPNITADILPDLENMKPKAAEAALQGMLQGNNRPEDLAAAFFSMEYPKFVKMVNDLSYNQLIRLCINLAGNEFVPDKNKLKTEEERHAFFLADQMIHNRTIMRLHFEMEKAAEAEKQQTKGEEENGKNQTS